MIKLKSNAKEIVNKYCNQKEVRASFYETLEAVRKKFEVAFSDRMQKLITKIGLIMSECSETEKIKNKTFLGSVDFLCYKVIEDPSRKKFLIATSVNENGNKNKHSLSKNEVININECVHQYNQILYSISSKYNLTELLKLTIKKENKHKKQPTKNIFAEARSIKYDTFDGNDIKFTLSPFYEFDKFKKIAIVELAVDWEKQSSDSIKITIISKKSGKKLHSQKMKLYNSNYENLRIPISVNDIDENNLISLQLDIDVFRKVEVTKTKTEYYQTGILFWKQWKTNEKEYLVNETKKVFSKTIYIAQCLREERNR